MFKFGGCHPIVSLFQSFKEPTDHTWECCTVERHQRPHGGQQRRQLLNQVPSTDQRVARLASILGRLPQPYAVFDWGQEDRCRQGL